MTTLKERMEADLANEAMQRLVDVVCKINTTMPPTANNFNLYTDEIEDEDVLAHREMLDAIDKFFHPETKPVLAQGALPWVRYQVETLGADPVKLIVDTCDVIAAAPGGDLAVEWLLGHINTRPLDEVEWMNGMYLAASTVLANCEEALLHMSNEAGNRPADIYRSYARPLRWCRDHLMYHDTAVDLLKSLLIEQSLPMSELDSPAWLDGYTGEVDKEADEIIKFPSVSTQDAELPDWANELGMDKDDFQSFVNAQLGGFSQLEQDEEIVFEDDHDVKEWVLEEIHAEAKLDLQEYFDLNLRGQLFKQYFILLNENEYAGSSRKTESEIMLKAIEHVLRHNATIENKKWLYIFLVMIEEDMLQPKQFRRLCKEYNLHFDGLEEDWLDQIKNLPSIGWGMWDRQPDKNMVLCTVADLKENSVGLESFPELYIQSELANCSTSKTVKATLSRPFVEAHLRVAFAGGTKEQANAAGWNAWREWMSPAGNAAFKAARKGGADNKSAMKAFWQVLNAEKKAEDNKIVGVRSNGLTLANGRFIDQHIALIKLKQNELTLTPDDKSRLKNLLSSKGWMGQLASAL